MSTPTDSSPDAAAGRAERSLDVRLLGAPQLVRDGRLLRFDTRKAVALLAYLAVTGRRHTREELATLLWPESDRVRSRSALRRTLFSASAVGPALHVERDAVGLVPGRFECDVTAFTVAAEGTLPEMQRALAVYQGDFLEGFTLRDSNEFEDWRAGIHQGLRRQLDRVLARLVEARVADVGLEEAIVLAVRRVTIDPLNEAAHQSLMALYEWNGQRTESLRQYRRCVRALERELGVAPLPETTAVYDAVRRHRLPRPDQPGSAPAVVATGPAARGTRRPAARPIESTPFVGRHREIEALRTAWDRAESAGHTIAVVGEVGSGKTALLAAVGAGLATDKGLRVLVIRGHEGEQRLAYGAASDLVRALMEADPAVDQQVPSADRMALTWLAPFRVSAGAPDEHRRDQGDRLRPSDRGRLFDAVRTALEQVRQDLGTGLLLAVEDVHWMDAESSDLVAFLIRRPVPGVLVVPTWRGTSSPTTVAAALAEGLAEDRAAVLRLDVFDHDEVAALLAAYGSSAGPDDVEEVRVGTGGLPLLVVERARLDPSRIPGASGDSDTLVRARIESAPETTRQVLTTIAVVGAPVDPDLLRVISGRSDQEVVTAVEDALARGLLVELSGRAEYDLPHDTLRRLAVEGASLARRRLLHGRTADALVRRGAADRGPGWSGSVARHLQLAGRSREASDWYVRSAVEAAAAFGHATAELHWQAALALGHDSWTCHLGIGDSRVRIGRYREAIEAYEQAAAAATSDAELGDVEHRLGLVHDRLGEHLVAEAHLEAALGLLDPTDAQGGSRPELLADLALVSFRLGDLDRARDRALEAAAAASDTDAAALAQAYDVLGVVAERSGDLDAAREQLQTSLVHAEGLADPSPAIAALHNLARVEARAGRLADALDLAQSALDRSLVYGDTHRSAAVHDHLAELLHRAGREDEAREHQRQAAVLFAAVDREAARRPEIWTLVEW